MTCEEFNAFDDELKNIIVKYNYHWDVTRGNDPYPNYFYIYESKNSKSDEYFMRIDLDNPLEFQSKMNELKDYAINHFNK